MTQINEILLQYVKKDTIGDNILEFRTKLLELGKEMKIPNDVLEELTLILDMYE